VRVFEKQQIELIKSLPIMKTLTSNRYVFIWVLFLSILISSCSLNQKIKPDELIENTQVELFLAIDNFIQENEWINRKDTLFIKPYFQIDENSCSTYGYYNFIKSDARNDEANKELYNQILGNLGNSVKINDLCLACDKVFEFAEHDQAFTFSPLLGLSDGSFWIFAFRIINDEEIGYHFALRKFKNGYQVVDFYNNIGCLGFETDKELLKLTISQVGFPSNCHRRMKLLVPCLLQKRRY